MSCPTEEEVLRIAGISDPVQRNEAITDGYYRLSQAGAQLLGTENANWTTFGVWASQEAGRTIRGEELPAVLDRALDAVPELARDQARLNESLIRLGLPPLPGIPGILLSSNGVRSRIVFAMAGGNQAIFRDIGTVFARFVRIFTGPTHAIPAAFESYLAQFTPEQASLRDAFAAYARAMQQVDRKSKAELMLLGNAHIGAHEQRLVQPFLEQVFAAPEPVFREAIAGTLHLVRAGLPCALGALFRWRLWRTRAIDALTGHASAVFHRVATEVWGRYRTPREVLQLGDDLSNPPGLGEAYPPDLQDLKDPDLRALIARFDSAPETLQGSGTDDWSNYAQRMNFIVELFRSRAQDPCLFDPPFPSGNERVA
ncbi:MAG: hypothetical protein WBV82_22045 [Myxococcaceae bacterium]